MNKYFLVFIIILSNLCFSEENLDTADAPKTILFWNTAQKLDGFKNYKEILPTRLVSKNVQPYPLTYNLVDLSNLTYTYKDRKFSINDFIENFKVAGLIVVRDGVILHEDYNFGNSESTQWISFSVTL